jgi:hypothetical protein
VLIAVDEPGGVAIIEALGPGAGEEIGEGDPSLGISGRRA